MAVALAVWAAWYAAYRFYYAFGGHFGMIGHPSPAQHFRRENFVGGAIILLAALLPSIAVSAWRHRPMRRLVPVVGWIAAVGCCMHALTLLTLRVLSLTGVHPIHYPPGLWLSIDRREADLQDVFFNEPWFFIEGCLWALFTLTALQPSSRQRWRRSAVVACVLAAAVGLLCGLGALPTFRTGLTEARSSRAPRRHTQLRRVDQICCPPMALADTAGRAEHLCFRMDPGVSGTGARTPGRDELQAGAERAGEVL